MRKITLAVATALAVAAGFALSVRAATADVTVVINNTARGTGDGQVAYSSGWTHQGGTGWDVSYSWTAGSTATVRFTGTRIVFYGVKAPDHGRLALSVDGGSETTVDAYAAARTDGAALWTSPVLSDAAHTLRVRVTGTKNTSSRGTTITLDRFVVTQPAPTPTPSPTPTPTPTSAYVAARSGLPYNSGVFTQHQSRAELERWEGWRGRRGDVVVGFSARATWDDVIYPGWLYDAYATPGLLRSYSVPMIPEAAGASMATCAAGGYDDKWREFGRFLVSKGQGDSVIRLGWEMNGGWYAWSARDPQLYVACWRRIHAAVRSTAPATRWDWTVNAGPSSGLSDAKLAYPGDGYVDIVGIDTYDMWEPARDETSWQAQATKGGQGLLNWRDFARAHGKKLSVPEWGVVHDPHGGGDNPFYVARMAEFFRANADLLAYEAYHESDGAPAGWAHDLSRGRNPNAAAEYLRRYA